MTVIPAGTEVSYTVTFLEMDAPPKGEPPALASDIRLESAVRPPNWFFLSLYDAVGRDYEWVDWHKAEMAELRGMLDSSDVALTTAYRHGWPQGFFLLDWRQPGLCDLAYFGLVPEAVGGGYGGDFLRLAVHQGWARAGVRKMTVNTCTLDHPRALGLYQKIGFKPVLSEDRKRVLTRDRDPSTFPA